MPQLRFYAFSLTIKKLQTAQSLNVLILDTQYKEQEMIEISAETYDFISKNNREKILLSNFNLGLTIALLATGILFQLAAGLELLFSGATGDKFGQWLIYTFSLGCIVITTHTYSLRYADKINDLSKYRVVSIDS